MTDAEVANAPLWCIKLWMCVLPASSGPTKIRTFPQILQHNNDDARQGFACSGMELRLPEHSLSGVSDWGALQGAHCACQDFCSLTW